MLKKKNNSLDNRREFYIYRVTRNNKMYDDEETEREIISKNQVFPKTNKNQTTTLKSNKKVISYAESFGYHEDPKRYNNLRSKKTVEQEIQNATQEIENHQFVEEPLHDKSIGYFDEGVVLETSLEKEKLLSKTENTDARDSSFDNIEAQIDEIYQENFYQEPISEEMVDDIFKEALSYEEELKKEPVKVEKTIHFEEEKPRFQELPTKPIVTNRRKTKYIAPSLELLTRSDAKNADNVEEAKKQQEIINNTFREAGIRAQVEKFIFGPTVTQFLITIEKGANVKDVRKVESNLLMYLQCESIRIQTPIPGKPFAGIEVPKKPENRRIVYLGDMLASKDFKSLDYSVPVAVGEDNYGIYHYIDLVEMPHGLIAGTTKSGKSVCLNTFILSLIYRFSPNELRLVLIDPKRIELGSYEGIPHLAMPVIVDQEDFQSALGWVYDEMERRYKEFELYDEQNINDYNNIKVAKKEPKMPHIIVIMDEFSDWFADANSEIESYMQKLAAKARAAGINIILATQRPSKDVIKGTIKANFDTRIAFRVSSFDDAKVILGYGGAEKLEGRGDMLIRYAGKADQRLQGAYVPNNDIKKVTRFLKENNTCEYLVTKEEIHQSTLSRQTTNSFESRDTGRNDERFEEVAFYVVRNKNASINQLTQIFKMGFNRVNDIFFVLEEMGVLSPSVKGKQREVLVDEFQLRDMLDASKDS